MRTILLILSLIMASLFSVHGNAKQDVKGSQDHPLLSRFPGSYIALFDFKNFDEYHGYGKDKIVTEGKITRIAYKVSKDHSTLEVFRSYESALKGGGFAIDYKCSCLLYTSPSPRDRG